METGRDKRNIDFFKYLGFMFNKKGDYKGHIKGLREKDRTAANKTCSLKERICRDDFSIADMNLI